MNTSFDPPAPQQLLWLTATDDQFGEQRSLGVSTITFKLCPTNPHDPLIIENRFHAKGGPALHLHHDQDEWFYVSQGSFLIEIDQERRLLQTGDSVLAPRRLPHVWAHVGETEGKLLIVFTPAGHMEAFFREVTKAKAMPPNDPALWQAHGMELLGLPLMV